MEYVKRRRLIMVSEEILKGHKIIDAALCCGWSSHSGFTKAFKQEFGFAPAFLKIMALQSNIGGNAVRHVFMNNTESCKGKEELFELLKTEMNGMGMREHRELDQAYGFACRAYEELKRYSGSEYITHPLNVAIIFSSNTFKNSRSICLCHKMIYSKNRNSSL